jgi:gas vesicle protein
VNSPSWTPRLKVMSITPPGNHDGFRIETTPYTNGNIVSSITDQMGKITTQVIKTQDEQIKQSLISLGWSSPEQTTKLKNKVQRLQELIN